ncbi:HTTM domain-containing protein [Natrinema salifodinae]|uniref:Vitamin K-dependent gamma-carboxylase n=1 Tax=Natrinema salifodinae TaxID=1202768 RepID=A0A1I0NMI8_9EURY|nr:HTTM domain-containing protein [Natrinema salifodinae]SEW02563.1 Vitamin K-dependent gamma-carboxylase [Natrinema salifodinae]
MNQETPTARDRLSETLDRASHAVERRFAIDLRALAAFRVAVGTLLLVDLLLRSRNLTAFYTDDGILPLEALFSDYSSVYSLHALSGEAWAQALLFCVAGAFALALLVGYRTRLATIASWLLLVSLHIRNPMILNGGDVLLRMLLFWGIFLPLGERWSIDARRIDRDRATVSSVGTMAILLQVALMYVTNAVHKTRSDAWLSGDAVVGIFQADQFTILLGNVLADYVGLLQAFTYVWMALILLSPLLIALTGYRRALLASLFVGMHLGMFVTIQIGIFPLVSVAGLVLFTPPVVWDGLATVATRVGIASQLRDGLAGLQRTAPRLSLPLPLTLPRSLPLPRLPSERGDVPSPTAVAARSRVLLSTLVPWLFLVLIVLANAQAVDYTEVPDPGEEVLDTVKADQSWRMFAPNPISNARWLVAPGELEDGREVDVYHDGAVDWDRPPSVDETYETSRWRKYVSNMRYAGNENHRSYYANYLCGRWNATHDTGVERVSVYGLTDRAEPTDDEPDIAEYELLEYDCSGEFVQND